MFRKMPFILLGMLAATAAGYPFMSLTIKSGLYALSLTIKSFILFTLPLIVFGLLFKTLITLSKRGTVLIVMVLILVCCANYWNTFLSHYIGIWIYHTQVSINLTSAKVALGALWIFNFPAWVGNDTAMLCGIGFGLLGAIFFPEKAFLWASKIELFISKFLQLFLYIIPVFIIGFMVKSMEDGIIYNLIKNYTLIFFMVALVQYGYILFQYFLLSGARIHFFLKKLSSMWPAMLSGFSTMSSAASLPLTLMGVESNTEHKALSKSIVPATVNIHLVGDCIAIPIFAYAVLKTFGHSEPSLLSYAIFAFYFMLAKFSVAAVPGGGILVMLPILHQYLGFNSEMLSLITALYILFDPVITSANILGNGAFALFIDKIIPYLGFRSN